MIKRFYPYIFFLFSCSFLSCGHDSTHDDEDDHAHAEDKIHIEPEQAAQFGVEYETVIAAPFSDVIRTSGMIEASGTDVQTLSAKKSGIISLKSGINVGSQIKPGETIATISSAGMEGGDSNKAALANLEAARAEYERLKPLYDEKLITASQFQEAKRVYEESRALAGNSNKGVSSVVTSSIDGTLQNLSVRTGDYVEAGSPIGIVAKNASLTLKADLPANQASHFYELETANFIPEGSANLIKLKDHEGRKISGSGIAAVEKGFIPVYFSFKGNPLTLAGAYAEVFLICGEKQGVISVPREALVEIQGNKYIYVVEGDHEYEKRLVVTGSTDGERIEIKEGLKEGEKIVSKGASIVRMAEVSAVAPPAHNHSH